ncbi:protein delta homolog 2 [Rhinophrynus dorsalis]
MVFWSWLLFPALCWVFFLHQTSAQADECSERCDLYHGYCDEERVCRCDPGWDGQFCENCVRMPGCVHGSCHQSWQCMCQSGWAGKFCDKDLHICEHSNPCQNNGECVIDQNGDYSCVCPDGFHGKNCEIKRGPCEKAGFPCVNGGTCQDNNGYADTFVCSCLAGYTGDLCQTDVDDCLMRPCANGATCHDGVNRFSCECPLGFQGRFCTVNIDDCAGQPCHNGGRCYDLVGDYKCYCPEGFMGKSCDIPIPKPTWEYEHGLPTTQVHRLPQTQTARTVGTGRGGPVPSVKPGTVHVKISVKEVVTQKEPGLSRLQLVILAVFGSTTGILLLLTVAIVLWCKKRGTRQVGWCGYSRPGTKTQCHECPEPPSDHGKTTEL